MKPARVACVRYLNTAPLIEGLDKLEGITLLPTVPSRIAGMVRGGEADVGLVSLVDAARGRELGPQLSLLPAGMIGCDGPTMTVRLFSSRPLERIERIHVDTDSHTSVVLCQLLLKNLHGLTPQIVDFDARERIEVGGGQKHDGHNGTSLDDAWPDTVLLIGDKVVTDAPPSVRYPHQLDLGEAWKAWTGLPFVYAMWACREDRAGTEDIRIAAALLDRQLRHNLTRLDWIVAKHGAEHRWPLSLAHVYLGDLLRFRIGEREREAVHRFLSEAADAGLLERPNVEWAEMTPQTARH